MRRQYGKTSTVITLLLITLFWGWLIWFGPWLTLKSHVESGVMVAKQWLSFHRPPPAALPAVVASAPDPETCDVSVPPHGAVNRLNVSNGAKLPAAVHLVNTLGVMALVRLAEEAGASYDVFLYPQQSTMVSLPLGNYTMEVEVGTAWCNLDQGFEDGELVASVDTLQLQREKAASIKLSAFGHQMQDVMISVSQSMGNVMHSNANMIEGQGELVLYRGQHGHYFIDGTINQMPVRFLVDTGASFVAISESFARRAGITECQHAKSQTANGVVDICMATARELRIGPFKLNNVTVDYSKGMSEDAFLLGMGVIGQFKVEQQGDVMKLKH